MAIKKNFSIQILCLLLLGLMCAPGFCGLLTFWDNSSECTPGTICKKTLQWQGQLRTYSIYLPTNYTKRHHGPLVIILHDSSNDGVGFSKHVLRDSFLQLANKNRFIVAFPDAVKHLWDFGSGSNMTTVDDVGFIQAVIESLQTSYVTNPKKTYVIGMASGGMMVFKLLCDHAVKISAAAVVVAAMPISLASTCAPSKPISVVMIQSHDDNFLPWNGQQMFDLPGKPTPARLTIPQTYQRWLELDKIYTPPINTALPTSKNLDGSWAWVEKAENTATNTAVVMYTVYGAGHTWPGGGQYLPNNYVGKVSNSLDASQVIWQFFLSH